MRWSLTLAIVVMLIAFARGVDWSAAWGSMRGARMSLLAGAVIVNFLSLAIKGVRWWLFLKPAGARSLGLAFRTTLAGCGLNNVLVANGGDAARVVFVARATGVPSSRVLATVALERLFDPVGFVILLVFGVLTLSLPASLERWRVPSIAVLAGVIGLMLWLVRASAGTSGPAAASPVAGIGRTRAYFRGFMSSTRELSTYRRFAAALLISLVAWVGQVATFHLAAESLRVTIPMAGTLAALLTTNLGLLIRATPGNVGFFQVAYVLALEPFGIAADAALAVSLLIQTIQIVPMTIIGVALAPEFILRGKAARSEAARIAHEHEPALMGHIAEEAEELARASRKS